MLKAVFLLKRKPGMTFEEFKSYYETTHALLGERVLPTAVRYIRRYLVPYPDSEDGSRVDTDYDVITEIWFKNRADFDAAITMLAEPNIQKEIAEDEERLMDRSKIQLFTVEEYESDLGNGNTL